MKDIHEIIGKELKWTQPHMSKMEYELRAGDELIATLRFRSSFGSLALAETASGCWSFKRVGFFQTRVTVRMCEGSEDIATFKNHTWKGGGTLMFSDGRNYLASTNFWATEYEIKTEIGETLVKFRKIGGVLHASSLLEVSPTLDRASELPLLATLGWYLTILMQMDSAATTTVIAAT